MFGAKKIIFYDPKEDNARNEPNDFFKNVRVYLKAKAAAEGWDGNSVDCWQEEFLGNPPQPDNNSCGVFVCMVTLQMKLIGLSFSSVRKTVLY